MTLSPLATEILEDLETSPDELVDGRATLAGLIDWLGEPATKVAVALDELIRAGVVFREGSLFLLAGRSARASLYAPASSRNPERDARILALIATKTLDRREVARACGVSFNTVVGVIYRERRKRAAEEARAAEAGDAEA